MTNGWASASEADAMFIEDMLELAEARDVIADATEHQRRHMIPRKDPRRG